LFLRESHGFYDLDIFVAVSGQLLILLPQCRVPAVFRIEPDLDLPWSTTHRAVLHEGLAASPTLIDIQLYVLAAVGAV